MNRLAKSAISPVRELVFSQDTLFQDYPLPYPVKSVQKCHYDVKVGKVGDYSHAAFSLKATLEVFDSRDGKPFSKKLAFKEDVDLLDEEDDTGEGYVIKGGDIDLDELALRLLVSALPIRLLRPESALPKGGDGYRVMSEEMKEKEAAEHGNPAFDNLPDYPSKK